MATISCLWTGVLETTNRTSSVTHQQIYTHTFLEYLMSFPANPPNRVRQLFWGGGVSTSGCTQRVPLVPLRVVHCGSVQRQVVDGPARGFLRRQGEGIYTDQNHPTCPSPRAKKNVENKKRAATDLNVRLGGVELQRRAAGLHPAQAQVLHLLPAPVLLLLALLKTLLGHHFALHDGRR